MYAVLYLPQVVKRDIPALFGSARLQIKRSIEKRLTENPMLYGKPLRFNHSGLRSLRVGDYRVIYTIDPEANSVTITAIGHRKDIYDR